MLHVLAYVSLQVCQYKFQLIGGLSGDTLFDQTWKWKTIFVLMKDDYKFKFVL